MGRPFREAPVFYLLFTALIAVGAGLVLAPGFPLLGAMIYSQALNGVLLPFILVAMAILVNRPRIMGRWRNSLFLNAVTWATVGLVTGAALLPLASVRL